MSSFIFLRYWKDFRGREAEIFLCSSGFGRILKGLRVNSCILFMFWKDSGGREAAILNIPYGLKGFRRA